MSNAMTSRADFKGNWIAHVVGDRVHIDGDKDIAAVVVIVRFHALGHDYVLEWLHNGCLNSATVDGFRLSPAGGPGGE